MPSNPVVILTSRQSIGSWIPPIDLERFFVRLGFQVVVVSNLNSAISGLERWSSNIVGLVLSGGGGMSGVGCSNALPAGYVDLVQTERDLVERFLYENFKDRGLPIIGICRGAQFLNCSIFNGALRPVVGHVKTQNIFYLTRYLDSTAVLPETIEGACYHNFGIHRDDLAAGLIPIYLDASGQYVEMFLNKQLKVFGLLWHPERSTGNSLIQRKLVQLMLANRIEGSVR